MAQKGDKFGSYWEQSRDLVNSLVLVLPLLLVYELGLLWTGGATINGVDFVTVLLARRWGLNGLLAFNGVLFVLGLAGLKILEKKRRLNPKIVLPVAVESTVYALLLGVVITLVMRWIPGLTISGGLAPGVGLSAGGGGIGIVNGVLISLGAGVNEELVFRLGLFGGLSWGLGKLMESKPGAAAIALVVSAALFSAAHYLNPTRDCAVCAEPVVRAEAGEKEEVEPQRSCPSCGAVFHADCFRGKETCPVEGCGAELKQAPVYTPPETFQTYTFVYRFLAGAIFCLLFLTRGFAVAVYTHAIYDVYVLVVLPIVA